MAKSPAKKAPAKRRTTRKPKGMQKNMLPAMIREHAPNPSDLSDDPLQCWLMGWLAHQEVFGEAGVAAVPTAAPPAPVAAAARPARGGMSDPPSIDEIRSRPHGGPVEARAPAEGDQLQLDAQAIFYREAEEKFGSHPKWKGVADQLWSEAQANNKGELGDWQRVFPYRLENAGRPGGKRQAHQQRNMPVAVPRTQVEGTEHLNVNDDPSLTEGMAWDEDDHIPESPAGGDGDEEFFGDD